MCSLQALASDVARVTWHAAVVDTSLARAPATDHAQGKPRTYATFRDYRASSHGDSLCTAYPNGPWQSRRQHGVRLLQSQPDHGCVTLTAAPFPRRPE